MKKKLLVSFSGGETSAFMSYWLKKNKSNEFDMMFVFANTGQENEETLEFVQKCDQHFGLNLAWVESVVHHGKRKGSTHRVVDYKSASRDGSPFEDVISKYGIPNQAFPHCTRELKANPIKSYANSIGWGDCYMAIGIRSDEADRISSKRKQQRLIYPLIEFIEVTKIDVNTFWKKQTFRLNLKGYQGNCKWCWKKNDPKLYQIAKEDSSVFDFPLKIEEKYGNFISEGKMKSMIKKGIQPKLPITFFRQGRSAKAILNEATLWDGVVSDDSDVYDESCEVFSQCGIDN